ncbi:hypothetical protein T05_7309 [Trichinella murrelli]|uniref:Uncharacterized protein n=1 Tax=Trichinella murrelli TaxID=144512 RepID=A0A0V0TYQ4_9BILA|nr:hypothetical protein T05_7309 [Trichinella murrelli]
MCLSFLNSLFISAALSRQMGRVREWREVGKEKKPEAITDRKLNFKFPLRFVGKISINTNPNRNDHCSTEVSRGGLICRLINVDNHINGRSQLDAAGQSELSVVQSPTSGYSDGSIFTVDRSVNSSTPPTDRPTD